MLRHTQSHSLSRTRTLVSAANTAQTWQFFAGDTETCIPLFDEKDESTYEWVHAKCSCDETGKAEPLPTKTEEKPQCVPEKCEMKPLRPHDYCQEQHAAEGVPNQHNTIIFTVAALRVCMCVVFTAYLPY